MVIQPDMFDGTKSVDKYVDNLFKKITLQSQYVMQDWFEKSARINPVNGNVHFSVNPMYNYLTNSHQQFYGIFPATKDSVLVTIKKVRMFQVQYNRLIGWPISLKGNKENEDKLFDQLFDLGYIEQALVPDYNLGRIDKSKYEVGEVQDCNFYADTELDAGKFNNKWLIDSRTNMMLRNPDFSYGRLQAQDLKDIRELYRTWAEGKGENIHSTPMFENYFNDFNGLLNLNTMLSMGIRYKGRVIAISVLAQIIPSYYYNLIQFGYRRDTVPDSVKTVELDKILSQVGQIIRYLCFSELKAKKVRYISYAGGMSKALIAHKTELTQHRIDYYRIRRLHDK